MGEEGSKSRKGITLIVIIAFTAAVAIVIVLVTSYDPSPHSPTEFGDP